MEQIIKHKPKPEAPISNNDLCDVSSKKLLQLLQVIKKKFLAVFAPVLKWKRKVYCDHLFRAKDMQTRDENGKVKWVCCKCNKLFVAECGLDILKHGTCDGKWGAKTDC